MLRRRLSLYLLTISICSAGLLVIYSTSVPGLLKEDSRDLQTVCNCTKYNVPQETHPTCRGDSTADAHVPVDPMAKYYKVWHDPPNKESASPKKEVRIVFWTDLWDNQLPKMLPKGEGNLCPHVPECIFSRLHKHLRDADAVFFENTQLPKVYNKSLMPRVRLPQQHWVWFSSECPGFPSINFESYSSIFNWTINYREDSDSGGAWGSLHRTYKRLRGQKIDPKKDYTKGKKKLAVWFISKCNTQANRIEYATELIKHLHVDVFGRCGKTPCAKWNRTCMPGIIKQYKFYLAFENMLCKDYITEKYWRNALENDVVPVVLGAPKSDYERLAPPNSYIHVDDFKSPKELADYLRVLDKDKEKYNAYFKWKLQPPKNMPIDDNWWCNLCRRLFEVPPTRRKLYTDLKTWFEGENLSMCKPMVDVPFQQLKFAKDHFEVTVY